MGRADGKSSTDVETTGSRERAEEKKALAGQGARRREASGRQWAAPMLKKWRSVLLSRGGFQRGGEGMWSVLCLKRRVLPRC